MDVLHYRLPVDRPYTGDYGCHQIDIPQPILRRDVSVGRERQMPERLPVHARLVAVMSRPQVVREVVARPAVAFEDDLVSRGVVLPEVSVVDVSGEIAVGQERHVVPQMQAQPQIDLPGGQQGN